MNRQTVLIHSILVLATTPLAPAQKTQCARQFGKNSFQESYAVSVGGVDVTGATASGVVPGGAFAGGLWDVYLTKLDPANGDPLWSRQIGTTNEDGVYSVAAGTGFARGAGAPSSSTVLFVADRNDGPQELSPIIGADGKMATSLGGTEVLVCGIPAPIPDSAPNPVSIQIPFEAPGAVAIVSPTAGGQFSEYRSLELASRGPGIFTENQAGTGEAVAPGFIGLNQINVQIPNNAPINRSVAAAINAGNRRGIPQRSQLGNNITFLFTPNHRRTSHARQ